MFELILAIVIRILLNLALLGSLATGLCIVAALALASITEDAETVEVTEFDPETLRARQRRLRVLPVQHEEGVQPQTPPENPPLSPLPQLRPRRVPVPVARTPSPIEVQVQVHKHQEQ